MKRNGKTNVSLATLRYFYGIAWKVSHNYVFSLLIQVLCKGITPLVNIVLPRMIVDELLLGKRADRIMFIVAVMAGANLVSYLLNNLAMRNIEMAHYRIEQELQLTLGRSSMNIPFSATEAAETIEQLTRARAGINGMYTQGGLRGINRSIVEIGGGVITLIGTVYMIASLSWWIVGLLLAVVLVNLKLIAKGEKAETEVQKAIIRYDRRVEYFGFALKDFNLAKDIRLYSAQDLLFEKTMGFLQAIWDLGTGVSDKRVPYELVCVLSNTLQQVFLYIHFGIKVIAGGITIGALQMMISAAIAFSTSLSAIVRSTLIIKKNLSIMHEFAVYEEISEAAVEREAKGNLPAEITGAHTIVFDNVSFTYPGADRKALDRISLTIPAGQKLSIVGVNGAGKTTLIKLLCRLYEPDEGRILIDDEDIRSFKCEEYNRLFSAVFQDFKLFPFTIGENISVSSSAPDPERLSHSLRVADLEEKIAALPSGTSTYLTKQIEDGGIELSGGENQRLAIARAVYKDAPWLILDEPTAALDPIAERDVLHSFDRMISGKTTLYISHRMATSRLCDAIAVIKDGRLAEYGTHSQLLALGGEYAKMWEAQAKYYI
jgi:ABC-type multidrug transport system fused ATPase/permease subunit